MKNIKLSILTIIIATSFSSCKKGGVFCYKGNGELVTEERIHTGFTEISLESTGDLFVEQGSDYSVEIETSENLMDIIETKVKGSTLEIGNIE